MRTNQLDPCELDDLVLPLCLLEASHLAGTCDLEIQCVPGAILIAAGMDYGDIVRLGVANGKVSVRKVDIIEVGDQSLETVEAYVRTAFKTMPDDTRLSLITELTGLLRQKREV
jgi:hypothetical protein